MKNKIILIIIIILFALTGALIWYAFSQGADENTSENNVFDENNSVESTEGMMFDSLPEPSPTPSEMNNNPESQTSPREIDLSQPPTPTSEPEFNQFQGTPENLEPQGSSPTSSLIPLSEIAKKKLLTTVG
jgi:cytoskeletal protein RodZ